MPPLGRGPSFPALAADPLMAVPASVDPNKVKSVCHLDALLVEPDEAMSEFLRHSGHYSRPESTVRAAVDEVQECSQGLGR